MEVRVCVRVVCARGDQRCPTANQSIYPAAAASCHHHHHQASALPEPKASPILPDTAEVKLKGSPLLEPSARVAGT